MDSKDTCLLCSGKPMSADTVNSGIKTIGMCIDQLGFLFGRVEERDYIYNGVQMNGNVLMFDNSAREYAPLGIRINFCPICGRKLENKEEE